MIHPNTTMQSELSFLICGLEHSGTTMASDLFREHPEVDSGFECGVLLCDNPSDFLTLTPFRNHMAVGWGINEEDLTYACQALALRFLSTLVREVEHHSIQKAQVCF